MADGAAIGKSRLEYMLCVLLVLKEGYSSLQRFSFVQAQNQTNTLQTNTNNSEFYIPPTALLHDYVCSERWYVRSLLYFLFCTCVTVFFYEHSPIYIE